MRRKNVVIWYCVLSLAAGLLLIVLSVFSERTGRLSESDKLMLGAVFIASCVLGVMQSARLHRPYGASNEDRTPAISAENAPSIKRVGHHPSCGRFDEHVTNFRGREYCSGCMGLAIGSSISLVLMLVYLVVEIGSTRFSLVAIFAGVILVSMDLTETAVHSRSDRIHVLANILLVVGFLLVTVGVLEATGNVIYGLLSILISFLWMDTRIQLSNWKHRNICQSCGRDCKSY